MPFKPTIVRSLDYYEARQVDATGETYTPSNATTTRTFGADNTTIHELADVLGTLIADLQTAGIID